MGNYVVDFACLDKNLIIELDGSQHMDAVSYDQKRNSFLQDKGFTVMRFWNNQIFEELESVLEVIHRKLTE